jgi:GT2 family glycosyltransferase
VTADDASVWVGLLEMDDPDTVQGIDGSARPHQRAARLLVRQHGAPIGHVQVPAHPLGSLAERARVAAEAALGAALQRHAELDSASGCEQPPRWPASVACPLRFPSRTDAGITVVVCTRDRPGSLRECLGALGRIDYKPMEILVVDNAPAGEETRRVVTGLAEEDSRVRYACERRPGLSNARNHGLRAAQFDLVAFTDDDALADQGWLAALAAGFTADPAAWCVTGMVTTGALGTVSERYFDARYVNRTAFLPRRYDLAAHRPLGRLYPFMAGMFGTGANFAVRREAVGRLGGFDPLLGAGSAGRGGEDLDMFLRIILGGGRICYVPAALVWHRHRASAQALGAQMYSYGHGLGAYLAKHIADRRLRSALLGSGHRYLGELAVQMYRASRESHLGPYGARLALTEAGGVVMGAARYRRAARRRPASPATPW